MAKSDIGTITVFLKAMSEGFDKALQKSSNMVGKFQKSVQSKTGKMEVAWTSLQSKISMVTGGLEGAFKTAAAASKLFKGDIDEAVDMLKTLPMGIGPVVGAMEAFYLEFSGWGDAIEKQETQLKKLRQEYTRMKAEVDKTKAAIAGMAAFTGNRGTEGARLRQQKWEGMGQGNEFNRQAEEQALVEEYNKLASALMARVDAGKLAQQRADIEMAAGLASMDERLVHINAYYDQLEKTAALEEKTSAIQKGAAEQVAALTAQASHEMQIMAIQEQDQEAVSKRRLQYHEQLTKALEDERAKLEALGGADAELIDSISAQISSHAQEAARELEIVIEQLLSKQEKAKQSMPSAVSNAFSTAVGQIVLPDARATQDIARAHLSAQDRTTDAIEALRDEFAQLTQGNP